jgi:hypothetical protein
MIDTTLFDNLKETLLGSSLSQEKKQQFVANLSAEKLTKLSIEELAELLKASRIAIDEREQQILASGDPDAVADYTEAKAFIDDLFFEAETQTLKDLGAIDRKEEASLVAARNLLEKLATPQT